MEAIPPFLPPREPSNNPAVSPQPKKRGAYKTIALWALLIVMFISIYQLFTGPVRHGPVVAEPRCPEPSFWSSGYITVGVPVLMVVAFVVYLRRLLSGNNLYSVRCEPAQLAFADGDYGRALELFGAVEAQYKGKMGTEASSALAVADVLVHQGAFRPAAEAFMRAERGAGLAFGADARVQAAIGLARTYALEGQLDAARRWADDARKRLGQAGLRINRAAQLRIVDAIVAARAGDGAQVAQLLDPEWHRLEHWLTGAQLREAWLVRAFVSDGGQRGQAETWLRLVRSGRRGLLDYVGAGWPEMQAFLAANDLLARAA